MIVKYNQDGWVKVAPLEDLDDATNEVEVTEDTLNRLRLAFNGCAWRYINGEFELESYKGGLEREDAKFEIIRLKDQLTETDYVAIKLAEVIFDADAYQALLEKYADILTKRDQWREKINQLQNKYNLTDP